MHVSIFFVSVYVYEHMFYIRMAAHVEVVVSCLHVGLSFVPHW